MHGWHPAGVDSRESTVCKSMQVKEFRAGKRVTERLRRKQEQQELADTKAALQAEKVRFNPRLSLWIVI